MFLSRICILLFIIVAAEGRGPDPWDRSKLVIKPNDDTVNYQSKAQQSDSVSDIFYKRLLQLLVNRGRFRETSNKLYEGYLHFEFSSSEFELMRKFSLLSVPFTSKELREIDAILASRLIYPSAAHIIAENFLEIVVRFFENYYTYILLLVGFGVCIYTLRFINWTMLATTRSLLIIFLFVCIVWECKLELEEADKQLYEKMSPPWWKFWQVQEIMNVKDIKSIAEVLQPVNIVGKLLSKIIFMPLKEFLKFLGDYTEQISGKFWFPLDSIIYMFITMSYLGIVIFLVASFVFYLIFGTSFDFTYLGFRASMTGKKGNEKHYESEKPGESLKDHNVNALIAICSKLVDKHLEIQPQALKSEVSNSNIENNKNSTVETLESICSNTSTSENDSALNKILPEVKIRKRNLSQDRTSVVS